MPNAVTHVLIPIILVEFYRDYFVKKRFALHYVLIAGIAGLLPDVDVIVYWFLNYFYGFSLVDVHRVFSHNLFIPLFFLILGLLSKKINIHFLSKHKLKLEYIFYVIAFGTFTHLILDFLLVGIIRPFYPFSDLTFGLNLFSGKFSGTLIAGLDAILLVLWLIHEEVRHKISSFI